jgi:hypothetical protein
MVGIDTRPREGFTALRSVDQFALCGISPETRLTFEELRRQATRVSVLLHSDFRRPPKVTLPFSSAIANDLKGWFQDHANSEGDRNRAVRLFYANNTGHRGLTWRPYNKDENGVLVSRSDPAIWRLAGSTPPPSPSQPESRKRKREIKKDEIPVPDKKRKTNHGKSGCQRNPTRSEDPNVSGLEKDGKSIPTDTKPSAHEGSNSFNNTNGPILERSRSTYASTPRFREEPRRRDGVSTPMPPSPTKPPKSSNQKSSSSPKAKGPVPERDPETYSTKPSNRGRSSRFDSSSNGQIPERSRNTHAATPKYREEPQPKHKPKPKPKDRTEKPRPASPSPPLTPPPRAATPKPTRRDDYADEPLRSPSPVIETPLGALFPFENLYELVDLTGDASGRRIAIAYLPDEQDCVVTMVFDPARHQTQYRVEQIDVLGWPAANKYGCQYDTTYRRIMRKRNLFLGRFVGANEEELGIFAMYFYYVGEIARLPYGDRSPSWNENG